MDRSECLPDKGPHQIKGLPLIKASLGIKLSPRADSVAFSPLVITPKLACNRVGSSPGRRVADLSAADRVSRRVIHQRKNN
ncbi:hypothetical protein TNCT_523961 [Trichonephila clavata]|uniref:Uncharacterized protein n=1 Tax=Trichonephila clavata TaxID=2740835 RepID=A0A8X6HRK6_TRICU|nr:hypothetical protein TNCT_523961 [Trichonephila clavata]